LTARQGYVPYRKWGSVKDGAPFSTAVLAVHRVTHAATAPYKPLEGRAAPLWCSDTIKQLLGSGWALHAWMGGNKVRLGGRARRSEQGTPMRAAVTEPGN